MTRRRFYAPPHAFQHEIVTLAADEARHLRNVLRLKLGDEVYVFNGRGQEFRCMVADLARDAVEVRVESEVKPAKPESQLQLNLCVALLKGEKFDLVVQKATELGVNRVTPLVTRYADIRLRDEADATKRVTRWQRIAFEAAKQSGRALVPEVKAPVSFASVVAKTTGFGVIFSEHGGAGWESLESPPSAITALVGSEGGWSYEELEIARAREFHVVTLGGRVLRAETAAITITALLQHRFGDLQ